MPVTALLVNAMSKRSVKLSKFAMDLAMILRITGITCLALNLALSYSDEKANLFRIYTNGGYHLLIIIFALFLDLVLTLLWPRYEKINTIHLILHILFSGIFFVIYVLNVYRSANTYNIFALSFVPLPCAWTMGLITFIIYRKARYKHMVAKIGQENS